MQEDSGMQNKEQTWENKNYKIETSESMCCNWNWTTLLMWLSHTTYVAKGLPKFLLYTNLSHCASFCSDTQSQHSRIHTLATIFSHPAFGFKIETKRVDIYLDFYRILTSVSSDSTMLSYLFSLLMKSWKTLHFPAMESSENVNSVSRVNTFTY